MLTDTLSVTRVERLVYSQGTDVLINLNCESAEAATYTTTRLTLRKHCSYHDKQHGPLKFGSPGPRICKTSHDSCNSHDDYYDDYYNGIPVAPAREAILTFRYDMHQHDTTPTADQHSAERTFVDMAETTTARLVEQQCSTPWAGPPIVETSAMITVRQRNNTKLYWHMYQWT